MDHVTNRPDITIHLCLTSTMQANAIEPGVGHRCPRLQFTPSLRNNFIKGGVQDHAVASLLTYELIIVPAFC